MENNNPTEAMPANSGDSNQKKVYQTPKIQRFGGLAELVQLRPGRGADGETIWPDCTS
ncbi:hypothetical protein [Mucilaginibacter ginsenosidivorans]|uniref:hypothetical protein n=1 Tax=Mucilaginibacter ginsenosidivorans TaxID=398053 RepID=UPI001651D116|nr:hypothetical protein [Mucilaginibacter ginsenosidivorans]